jgi:hypothetical protein
MPSTYGLSSLRMQLAIPDADCRGLAHQQYGIGSAFVLAGALTLLGGLLPCL